MNVVLLHGYDSTPAAMTTMGQTIVEQVPGAIVFCAQGPIELGGGRFAWWNDPYTDVDVTNALKEIAALSSDPSTTVFAGFSQGGALALAAGFSGTTYAGVICVGGFLPEGVDLTEAVTPMLIVHGEDDETVDPFYAGSVARQAKARGCTVDFHEIAGGHAWSAEATKLLVDWLKRLN